MNPQPCTCGTSDWGFDFNQSVFRCRACNSLKEQPVMWCLGCDGLEEISNMRWSCGLLLCRRCWHDLGIEPARRSPCLAERSEDETDAVAADRAA